VDSVVLPVPNARRWRRWRVKEERWRVKEERWRVEEKVGVHMPMTCGPCHAPQLPLVVVLVLSLLSHDEKLAVVGLASAGVHMGTQISTCKHT
jgi:hypothetical protein